MDIHEAGTAREAAVAGHPRVGVVVPAHDEGRGIAATLGALRAGVPPGLLDVVVVCNGCTDDTAARAAQAYPEARVIELATPSKAAAVRAGNAACDVFPRVHLDADVRLTGADLLLLVAPLLDGDVLATAPRRVLRHDGTPALVRWYYDVWEQLPQVRSGLFGRGAFALSAAGQARVDALPELMSDDLVVSDAFADAERRVVEDSVVEVRTPGSVADLVRRRTRVATGVTQASAAGARRADSATTPATLLALAVRHPWLAPRLPVFLGVTLLARRSSRRAVRAGDYTTWLRDESSRA
ncbi:glycosyltransferase [Nocardioides sp. 1609]|uniref:glycosyltransferase family 2 protein n=1 Tax=Nocardioides sp. 1609 TaxID=2508327 RepID=UPI00106F6993|nr:glycosyltransferase [Nocardioides sp. 1609]